MMPISIFSWSLGDLVAKIRRSLFLLIFLISVQKANACKCAFDSLTLSSIKQYDLIFYGEVTAVTGCSGTSKAVFNVKELFKGKCYQGVTVEFDCTSDCQMNFAPGQTWIVYATYKKYNEPQTEFCSFSRQKTEDGNDFNTSWHGKTFEEEKAWLEKNLGVNELTLKNPEDDQHHENIRPQGYQALWYLGGGFIALIVLYFVSKKFLK